MRVQGSSSTHSSFRFDPVHFPPRLPYSRLPSQDHLHAAKNLVETFKEPVCLVPVELPQVRVMALCCAASSKMLRTEVLKM
jgi:hypothetical protein